MQNEVDRSVVVWNKNERYVINGSCSHPNKQIICGTLVCPTCYEEDLHRTKIRARNVKLEIVYDPVKHMKVVRKAK